MRSRDHRQRGARLVEAVHLEKALAVLSRVCRVTQRLARLQSNVTVGRQPQEQTVADRRRDVVDSETRRARRTNVREVDEHTTLNDATHHADSRLWPPLLKHHAIALEPHAVVRDEGGVVAGSCDIRTILLHHQTRTVELDSAEHFGWGC